MTNRPVSVRIFHPEPGPGAGPLERWVTDERSALAERHVVAFRAAGAAHASIVSGPPDHTPFGARLRALVRAERPNGLVVLGSGAIPHATGRDLRDLVAVAGAQGRVALANNRYSADVVAISCAEALAELPDLASDNAVPRWLEEVVGYRVSDLRSRWRLSFDLDGPLEVVLLGKGDPAGVDLAVVRARLAAVRAVAHDRRAELLVAGRVSRRTLAWLESRIPARIRALVEERGLRAASNLAQRPSVSAVAARRPATVIGLLLDRDGPGALGSMLALLGDAAVVDTRVLLAHRLGADERSWPPPEDRYASDLLLSDRVRDPWLRRLTQAAIDAPIPVVLGGHSIVDSGSRFFLGRRRQPAWR